MAVAVDGEAVLVATAARLLRLHPDGAVLETGESPSMVSAVARHNGAWLVGQRDGTVEVLGSKTMDRAHGRQVTTLAAEGELLAAGYVDGTLALWHAPSGRLLALDRIHGTVNHLGFDGDALHAGSMAGDLAALPTGVLTRPHCAVLAEVAARVSWGWEDRHLVDLAPPSPCRQLQHLEPDVP